MASLVMPAIRSTLWVSVYIDTYVHHCGKYGTVHRQTALRRPAATLPAASATATAAVAVVLQLLPNAGRPKAIRPLSAL